MKYTSDGNGMRGEEAAKMSGYSKTTICEWIKSRKFLAILPKGKRGGWRINRKTFADFLESRPVVTNGWEGTVK